MAFISGIWASQCRNQLWCGQSEMLAIRPLRYGKKRELTTRFRQPSHDSPVFVLVPVTRNVKTECDRDERWFISVDATDRLDCAFANNAVTSDGPYKGTGDNKYRFRCQSLGKHSLVTTSVTVVRPDLSCLISCFLQSNSP
jgi:hypothetical protein